MGTCPECGSKNTTQSTIGGKKYLMCNDCFYDETEQFEAYPEERPDQKEKAKHNPYRAGGPKGKR